MSDRLHNFISSQHSSEVDAIYLHFSDKEAEADSDLPKVTLLRERGRVWILVFFIPKLISFPFYYIASHRYLVQWSGLGRTEVSGYFIFSFDFLKGAGAFTEGNKGCLSLIYTQTNLWLSLLYIVSWPPCAHILGFGLQSLLAFRTHFTLLLWFTNLCLPHLTLQFALSHWIGSLQSGHKTISIPKRISLYYPFTVTPSPHPKPLATTDLFSFPIVLSFWECHTYGIIQYTASCIEGFWAEEWCS